MGLFCCLCPVFSLLFRESGSTLGSALKRELCFLEQILLGCEGYCVLGRDIVLPGKSSPTIERDLLAPCQGLRGLEIERSYK